MTYTAPYGQMYLPMSDAWIPALGSTVLQVECYAEIWSGIPEAASPGENTLLLGDIEVVDGAVTIDRNNVIRRSATNVTLLPDAAGELLPIVNSIPTSSSSLYAPYGAELRIYKGIVEADGGTEYAMLGIFMIEGVQVERGPKGITLVGTLKDRGQWLARHTFAAPFATDGTSTVDVAITDLLLAALGDTFFPFPVNLSSTGTTFIPAVCTYSIGDDPFQSACDLAATAGLELYFDYGGTLQLVAIPDPTVPPGVIGYEVNTPTSPSTIKRVIDNSTVPNVICVQSQGSGVTSPMQVFWWDSNPDSPSYYANAPSGGFSPGPVTVLPPPDSASFYPTYLQVISTSDIGLAHQGTQAQAMANAAGYLAIGSLENCTITLRDNPAEDVDDIITLYDPLSGIVEGSDAVNYVVDQCTIQLNATKFMSVTARPVMFAGAG